MSDSVDEKKLTLETSFRRERVKKVFDWHVNFDAIVQGVTMTFNRAKNISRFTFLLDTGAQYGMINKENLNRSKMSCSTPIASTASSLGHPSCESKGFNYLC